MLSRVVPSTSLTMARSPSARQLMKVLLPALRRPTMASFSASSGARRGFVERPRGNVFDDAVEQLVFAAVLLGADAGDVAEAELVELRRLRDEVGGVAPCWR